MRKAALLLCCWVCAVSLRGFAAAPPGGGPPREVEIGGTLSEASLRGLNGRTRKLSEFRGRPLIINVWASWCGPCRAEMASLERLAWLDIAKRFTIIGISTDDESDKAAAYLSSSNATISHFIDTHLQMETMLGAKRIPLTVLIDAKGRIVDKVYGAQAWDGPVALKLIREKFRIASKLQ